MKLNAPLVTKELGDATAGELVVISLGLDRVVLGIVGESHVANPDRPKFLIALSSLSSKPSLPCYWFIDDPSMIALSYGHDYVLQPDTLATGSSSASNRSPEVSGTLLIGPEKPQLYVDSMNRGLGRSMYYDLETGQSAPRAYSHKLWLIPNWDLHLNGSPGPIPNSPALFKMRQPTGAEPA